MLNQNIEDLETCANIPQIGGNWLQDLDQTWGKYCKRTKLLSYIKYEPWQESFVQCGTSVCPFADRDGPSQTMCRLNFMALSLHLVALKVMLKKRPIHTQHAHYVVFPHCVQAVFACYQNLEAGYGKFKLKQTQAYCLKIQPVSSFSTYVS